MRFITNQDTEHLKEVTSIGLLTDKGTKFDKDGIFSPAIFGSTEYACECGFLKGSWHTGELCHKCNTTVMNPKDNIYKNGKLKIPKGYKVFNPVIYMIICKHVKKFDDMINPQYKQIDINGHIIYERENGDTLVNFTDFTSNYKEVIERLIPDSIEFEDEDDEKAIKKLNLKEFLLNNEDSVMLNSIPLLPLHLRPSSINEKQMALEPLNKCYIAMNTHINSLRNSVDEEDVLAVEKELYEIQKIYIELSTKILEIISSKEGLCRDQILSNRSLFSGRAVITLKDDNDPETVTIPRIMFTEMYMPRILTILVNLMNINYTEAYEYYFTNRFNLDDENITKCIDDVLATKPVVIINRNPSLHLLSMQAFYIKNVTKDNTIKLSKQVLRSYNADFDFENHYHF